MFRLSQIFKKIVDNASIITKIPVNLTPFSMYCQVEQEFGHETLFKVLSVNVQMRLPPHCKSSWLFILVLSYACLEIENLYQPHTPLPLQIDLAIPLNMCGITSSVWNTVPPLHSLFVMEYNTLPVY